MNPQDNATTTSDNLSLPPVNPGAAQPAAVPAQPTQPPAPVAPSAPPTAEPPVVAPQPAADPADDTPLIADDNDLIEKEWVEKAKELVEQTKNDPHKQNEEINKFKASYIKKRYNKDIKLSS